jgi:hypothetical protein
MLKASGSLNSLLYKLAGQKYKDLVTIALSWNSIVGKIMAERSSIAKFEYNILYIKAINHAWLQEFLLKKNEILKYLNEKGKITVKDIIFFV